MSSVTVLGASGFIGSHVVQKLKALQIDFYSPRREEDVRNKKLGNVIYCIGLTADFRGRPFETVEAHVCKLLQVLQDCDFDSLLYLSSTRLYDSQSAAREDDALHIKPLNTGDLYNISKAMGESLALSSGKKVRIARISNVYGGDFTSGNFLSSIIRDAVTTNKVTLQTSFDSEKDYISVESVADLLIKIATAGSETIYNLASGTNTSNFALTERIRSLTGCEVVVASGASKIIYPHINIERIRREFHFKPMSVVDDMNRLVRSHKKANGRDS